MQAKVTDQGLLIPKDWLNGAGQVEIVRENDRIIVIPVVQDDPIWSLGSQPVKTGISDASENLDTHLSKSV